MATPSEVNQGALTRALAAGGLDLPSAFAQAVELTNPDGSRSAQARMMLGIQAASAVWAAEHCAELLAELPAGATAADLLARLRAEADAMDAVDHAMREGSTTPLPELFTVERVAELAGISQATVRAYAARGQMPAPTGKVGRSPIWAPETIQPWLDARQAREQGGAL
jgi:hypothetical protein